MEEGIQFSPTLLQPRLREEPLEAGAALSRNTGVGREWRDAGEQAIAVPCLRLAG